MSEQVMGWTRRAAEPGQPIEDSFAYQCGYECGQASAVEEATASLAEALVRVAAPIWHRGDGRGGWLLLQIDKAAAELGLSAPAEGPVIRSDVRRLAERDGWACHYCGVALGWGHPLAVTPPEVDHVFPRSKGGSDSLSNKVLSCKPCNSAKGALPHDEFCRPCGVGS